MFLIRNRYTFSRHSGNRAGVAQAKRIHKRSFANRYPMLPDAEFEYSWG